MQTVFLATYSAFSNLYKRWTPELQRVGQPWWPQQIRFEMRYIVCNTLQCICTALHICLGLQTHCSAVYCIVRFPDNANCWQSSGAIENNTYTNLDQTFSRAITSLCGLFCSMSKRMWTPGITRVKDMTMNLTITIIIINGMCCTWWGGWCYGNDFGGGGIFWSWKRY